MLKYKNKAQHVASNFGLKCCKKDSKEEDSKLNLVEGTVSFKINGVDQKIDSNNINPSLSLARYIRDYANLKGTKISCNQAGCGACVVTAKVPDLVSGSTKTMSINSCVAPVLNCNGFEITTIEGLGNEENINAVQERLAVFNGTQCGFCSPGMVMQMNSLLQQNSGKKTTVGDIENVLDGNICRCTGYRPIFDAFKSFASTDFDTPDIEDIVKCQGSGQCSRSRGVGQIKTTNGTWYIPTSLDDLLKVLNDLPNGTSYRLVHGNTGRGVYDADTDYDAYISLKGVPELVQFQKSPLVLGGGMSLTSVIDLMDEVSASNANYKYTKTIADHIRKVAHPSVRNAGTIAGNLMLKHAYPDFPSDLFVLMEAAKAKLILKSYNTSEQPVSPVDFLATDMTKKILLRIELPATTDLMFSYKTMQRAINTHAYVNGALRIKVDANGVVQEVPSLVFGGISKDFIHASNTETFLNGKSLKNIQTLKGALESLKNEAIPENDPLLASTEYRAHLVQALFYRFTLGILGNSLPAELRSGAEGIIRNISSGMQHYETDPSLFPINKPVEKYEARLQCTGEAIYINDIPEIPGELHAAFVYSTMANCDLDTVDPTEALAMPGVTAYIDHNDIPGANSAIVGGMLPIPEGTYEQIFTTGRVFYAGQAIGLILASSFELAHKASKAVKITYKNKQKPILTIREALSGGSRSLIKKNVSMKPSEKGRPFTPSIFSNLSTGNIGAAKNQSGLTTIEGEFEVNTQYHFYMETQSIIARPSEKGQIDIYAASQWQDNVQLMVSNALAKPQNLINVHTRRVGGGYGGKTRITGHVAAAAAIAANKLNKSVRLVMDIESNMEVLGRRHPYLAQYKAGADENNKLAYVEMTIYSDSGFSFFEDTSSYAAHYAKGCYASPSWDIRPATVATNTASQTIARAPGTTPGMAIIENVMEHMAHDLGVDPLEFRIANMIENTEGYPIEKNILPTIIDTLKGSSEYDKRKQDIESFNNSNKWKKKGMSMVPMIYNHWCGGTQFYFQMSIYQGDGTIAISCGAIEMGQGINTKVIQTVAKELGVPMDLISMKPVDTMISPQNSPSWGSMTTDSMCASAMKACQEMKARLKVVEDTMDNPSWLELIQECYTRQVDLSVRHQGLSSNELDNVAYNIYAATVTEVEWDVLTGEHTIRRVDILEDTGTSINPEIDVGQLEGAFVMSLGLWLSEQMRYDPDTGRLLTHDTWEYKPPSSKDIPEDFRLTFHDSKRNTAAGVLGSKAVGEQTMLQGVSVLFALRRAIDSVKKDLGVTEFYTLDGPAPPEKLQTVSGATSDYFVI